MSQLIMGISHIFGEASSLGMALDFWKQRGWTLKKKWTLSVPEEKRKRLLGGKEVSEVQMGYLKRDLHKPGLEFLKHQFKIEKLERDSRPPLIRVAFKSKASLALEDIDQNQVLESPGLEASCTLRIRVPNEMKASSFLQQLGFTPLEASETEQRRWKQLFCGQKTAYVLVNSLLPQFSARIFLHEDPSADEIPQSDRQGLNGISLVTKSLDALPKEFDLHSHQEIEDVDGRKKRIAFSNQSGILVEFLEIDAASAKIN
jgi:hypothetical protein